MPEEEPARAYRPFPLHPTAVTTFSLGSSFQAFTFLSSMLHSRILQSKEPLMNKRSSVGWKATEVTMSEWGKTARQSLRTGLQSLAVPSVEADSRKLF